MSYCQRCGEKNHPHSHSCINCGAELPGADREMLQPGYGYDIHATDCNHGLKLEPMDVSQKLDLLKNTKYLYLGNLLLIVCGAVLLVTNIFRTDNSLWQSFLEQKTGLFGPHGRFFTGIYFLLLLTSLLFAGKPLYTRNTYNPLQLLPSMILEVLLLPILGYTVWTNRYFGSFMGTTLSTGGRLLLIVCTLGLIVQLLLIPEYRRLKRSGVYSYVAN